MNYEMDFISGDTKKCLLAVSLPMMVAMFLNMAYNLVDSLWIGNLMGETAYAALTNSTPLILILNSIAMGATNGISILLSQAVGAKDKKNVESIVMTSFLSSVMTLLSSARIRVERKEISSTVPSKLLSTIQSPMPKGRSITRATPAIRLDRVDWAPSDTAMPTTPAPAIRAFTSKPRMVRIWMQPNRKTRAR